MRLELRRLAYFYSRFEVHARPLKTNGFSCKFEIQTQRICSSVNKPIRRVVLCSLLRPEAAGAPGDEIVRFRLQRTRSIRIDSAQSEGAQTSSFHQRPAHPEDSEAGSSVHPPDVESRIRVSGDHQEAGKSIP